MLNELAVQIYEYVAQRIQDNYSPTVREIGMALGIKSTSTVHKYLNMLIEEGLLEKEEGLNRALRLTNSDHFTRVPVIGKVAAGQPITAIENIEGYVSFAGGTADAKDVFALRVRGDSMIDAGIFDGDYIVARRTPYAENGQIVIALIEDSATVKTFYKEDGHFRLQPENDRLDPIIVDEVSILGKVIGLIRNYE